MAGLLDGYGIDMDEIEAPSYDVADDIYEFEVSDFYIQEGTDNWPDRTWLIIEYSLGAAGKSKSEWFELPADASAPTDKELQKLGYYKNRLSDLGVEPGDMNKVGPDDLIGKTGTLQVFTKNGFQNIKGVKTTDTGENAFVEESPAPKRGARKPATAKEVTPEPEEEAAVEEEAPAKTAPRGSTRAAAGTAKARGAGVKENPFK